MRVRIIADTIALGHPVFVGDTIDVTDIDGRLLIGNSKATEILSEPEIEAAPETVETAEDTSVMPAVNEARRRTQPGRRRA
jgi:hypothetical protein